MKTLSGRHVSKLLAVLPAFLSWKNVAMTFPSAPTITTEMWKTAQNLDVLTLQLSFISATRRSDVPSEMLRDPYI
jgi:hypothetical protein